MLTQEQYIEVMGKLKDRRLRTELRRYGWASSNPEAKISVPLMVMERINASIRKHHKEASTPGTPPEDEVLR
jgi:hypothetical protein